MLVVMLCSEVEVGCCLLVDCLILWLINLLFCDDF